MDKALFYSMLIENFGPGPIPDSILPRMKKLAESQQVTLSGIYMRDFTVGFRRPVRFGQGYVVLLKMFHCSA
jgi:hypothetical protein